MRHLRMNKTNQKWFRVPDKDARFIAQTRITDALKDLDISQYAIEPPATIEMDWGAFHALLSALEVVALPLDRYSRWLSRNEDDGGYLTQINLLLHYFGFSETRKEIINTALHAIEPYPSRKPVDQFRIKYALEDAAHVVPADQDWGQMQTYFQPGRTRAGN